MKLIDLRSVRPHLQRNGQLADFDGIMTALYWTRELREESTEEGFSWEQVVCMGDLFTEHL